MPFVKTNFRLPTVTRADGTLAGYVQYNSNPVGDRYIWPAERIAIYQAQLAAKVQAAKKQKMFSLFDIFSSSPAPAPAARPGKKGVQTSAGIKGLAADTADTYTGSDGCVYDTDGNRLTCPGPGGQQAPTQVATIANAAQAFLKAVNASQTAAAINSGLTPPPNSQPQPQGQLVSGVPNTALYLGGGLAALGVLIAALKGGRR